MAFSPGFAWRRGMVNLGAMGRSDRGRALRANISPGRFYGGGMGPPTPATMIAYRRGKRRMLGIASGAAVLEAGRHMPAGEPWAGYSQTSTGAYNSYY